MYVYIYIYIVCVYMCIYQHTIYTYKLYTHIHLIDC